MTTNISAIIAQYITTHTRLIIPEVGTLIRRKESGEIVFMEMLKKSDGTLVGLVVNTLDVSPSKATETVNNYVASIKHQLATSKKFIIDGVGVLLMRADGSVDFSFNPFSQSIPEPSRGVDVLEEEDEVAPARTNARAAGRPQAAHIPQQPVAPMQPQAPQQPVAPMQPQAPQQPTVPQSPATPTTSATPTRPTHKVAPAPKPQAIIYRTEEEDEVLERKNRIRPHQTRRKIDGITIVAFVALLLALLSLIWGAIPSGDRVEVNVEPTEVIVNE